MISKAFRHPIWSFLTRTEVLIFLALWLSYGMLINAKNINDFGQNQATIEAIVDQGRFSIENLPNWEVTGDFFGHDGHRYMNKQPGQAFIGAIVYAHLRLVGLSYSDDKILAAALIAFFTISLLTALGGVVVFRFARDLTDRRSLFWPISAALAYGWGTIAFAYSGIVHHDALSAVFLITGFYLVFLLKSDPRHDWDRPRVIGAGLLLGLTLTTSMIPFFMVIIVGIYFLSLRKWHHLPAMLVSGTIGVLPMLAYNAISFGNPFRLPMSLYVSHPDDDAFFSFEWTHFLHQLEYYFRDTSWYNPVLWFGLAGIVVLLISSRRRLEGLTIIGTLFVLVFYLSNIATLGTCNYGPRYLLAGMPLAALGIAGLRLLPFRWMRFLVILPFLYIGIQSIVINLVGAIGGAMFCNLAAYAYPTYLADIMAGKLPEFVLLPWLIPFAAGFFVLLFLKPFVSAQAGDLGDHNMPTEEIKTDDPVEQEDLTILEFAKSNKVGLIILAGVGLAALFPFYSFLFQSDEAERPAAAVQSPVPPTPESTEPVNAFTGGVGTGYGRFSKPRAIAADDAGNIYVADSGNARVQKFDPAGNFVFAFNTASPSARSASQPTGVAVDTSGNIFVSDLGNGKLIKFSADGKFIKEWTGPEPGFYGPLDIAIGKKGEFYIVDSGRLRIVRFDPISEVFSSWGTGGSGPGQFAGSTGVAVGADQVFVADLGNDRVQVFDLDGNFLREWTVPVWKKYPWHYPDLVFDELTKSIYLTNGWENQILAFDLEGRSIAAEISPDSNKSLGNPSTLVITDVKKARRLIVLNTDSSKLSSFDLKGKDVK